MIILPVLLAPNSRRLSEYTQSCRLHYFFAFTLVNMDADDATMPNNATIVAIVVLLYSVVCLICGMLLLPVLYLSKEKLSYVFLFALSSTCSTIVNIIQQVNYIANWQELRKEQYELALAAYDEPTLALGPLTKGFNEALFWVALYSYNVNSMLILFWSMSLVLGILNCNSDCSHNYRFWIGVVSKVAACLLPAVAVGLRKYYQLHLTFVPAAILLNILMLCSLSLGSLCILFVFIKYLQSRLTKGSQSTAIGTGTGVGLSHGAESRTIRPKWKTKIDSWLVVRFTIAFLAMCALDFFLVFFEIRRYTDIQKVKEVHGPDFGNGATIFDVLNFIPGASSSLLAFLLFGTTRSLCPIYASMFGVIRNLFKRARPNSTIEDRIEHPAHMAADIEMADYRRTVTKGVSVKVVTVDRHRMLDRQRSYSKEYERYISRR